MNRDEFVSTIGYQGDSAIIDKNLLFSVKGLTTSGLLEKGFFRAGFCSAMYTMKETGDSSGQSLVLEHYNRSKGPHIETVDSLKRLFGVFDVPEGIHKCIYI